MYQPSIEAFAAHNWHPLPVDRHGRLLIQRAKDLTDDWYTHLSEIDKSLQDIGWQFASHTFGLHRDDYVQYGNRILYPHRLFVIDETIGNLGLCGRIATKSGIPGKRELEFSLLHASWT